MTTLQEVRARFARDQGLPFADSLSERSILDALQEHGVQYRDRLFSPVTTIWGFPAPSRPRLKTDSYLSPHNCLIRAALRGRPPPPPANQVDADCSRNVR
jgi:hypothetical protein